MTVYYMNETGEVSAVDVANYAAILRGKGCLYELIGISYNNFFASMYKRHKNHSRIRKVEHIITTKVGNFNPKKNPIDEEIIQEILYVLTHNEPMTCDEWDGNEPNMGRYGSWEEMLHGVASTYVAIENCRGTLVQLVHE